ncbi:MAG: methyltransferase domain-containing protein [Woeseiaceae bacterium]|nr:class I SAM-dependent methyltransferase [Gammaproteobacteria bacterium]NNK24008.1 methyltransferase domain-containing protein [Woeseiaceae bacterium]
MEQSQILKGWLESPLGEALLHQEARVVEEALDGIFGEHCLQLGLWGDRRTFLRFTRTQRCSLIDTAPDGEPGAVAELHRLPVESDSIDAVLLPHTLDFSDRQHEILREVDRVLRADGHAVILGFKPGGLWGLRRLIPGAGLPPGAEHTIPERRLNDWLKLLDMRVRSSTRYFFRWPLPRRKVSTSQLWELRGRRLWPELAACYMLTAQKRVSPLTPVRPLWRRQPQVVAGLAEPSARVSRIRFDKKSV